MRRSSCRYRLLLPLLALAGVTVVLLSRCGNAGNSGPAPGEADAKPGENPEPPADVDAWAGSFSRQIPPPATLRQDGAVLSDTLANGLRYLIMEQPNGEGLSLRLLVLAGSVHETEEELGFAHFVEHMAFRGTVHHPEGDALAMFERLGLKAGTHANAFTRPDCTVWKLDVTLPDETCLTTALQYFRDVTDGILFQETDVAEERGVVLRELEERYGKHDSTPQHIAAILPAVPAALRLPIGTRETLGRASAATLRAFWQRHYVPSRMVLVAAGDLQAREMAARLHQQFDSLPAREAPPEPPDGDPLAGAGAEISCLTNPAAEQIRISLAAPQPIQPMGDDLARRHSGMVRRLMLRMLTNRLDRLSAASRTRAVWRDADHVELTPRLSWLEVSGHAAPEDVKPALTFLASEWLRARDLGFQDVEFESARQQVRSALRKEFAERVAAGPADAADALVASVRAGTVFESPEDELNRARTNLGSLTKEECEARCREDWSRGVLTLTLEGKNVKLLADEAQRIVNGEWSKKPAAAEHYPAPRSLETSAPGPRGKVVRRTLDAARGLLEAELSNGVRLWLKPLPGLGGSVSVAVHAGHGGMSAPREEPALRTAAELLVYWNPLPGWNSTELEAALSPDDTSVKFDIADGTMIWRGETSRQQLARQLEVLCACVHTPGLAALPNSWRPSGRDVAWNTTLSSTYATQKAFREAISGKDDRLDPVPEGFGQTNSKRAAGWLLPILEQCRLSVIIAGDFAPDAALEVLTRTFGALPAREPWDNPNPWPPLPPPEPRLIETTAKVKTSIAAVMIPFRYLTTPGESINASLLREVISLRLRALFRNKLSASYSPGTQFWTAPDKSHDWLICHVKCDSSRLDEISSRIRALLEDLHTAGWTADEFQRAARPWGPWMRRHLRNPDTWILSPSQPGTIPPPGSLKPESLLLRQDAVKKLADEVLDVAAAVEVRIQAVEE